MDYKTHLCLTRACRWGLACIIMGAELREMKKVIVTIDFAEFCETDIVATNNDMVTIDLF